MACLPWVGSLKSYVSLQNIVSFIGLFAKETYDFKELTNRGHPISLGAAPTAWCKKGQFPRKRFPRKRLHHANSQERDYITPIPKKCRIQTCLSWSTSVFWYKNKITNLPSQSWLKGKFKQHKLGLPSSYRHPNHGSGSVKLSKGPSKM